MLDFKISMALSLLINLQNSSHDIVLTLPFQRVPKEAKLGVRTSCAQASRSLKMNCASEAGYSSQEEVVVKTPIVLVTNGSTGQFEVRFDKRT